jgi:hypothetical protein
MTASTREVAKEIAALAAFAALLVFSLRDAVYMIVWPKRWLKWPGRNKLRKREIRQQVIRLALAGWNNAGVFNMVRLQNPQRQPRVSIDHYLSIPSAAKAALLSLDLWRD